MTTAPANPRAFAVWFKDLDCWSVSSFFKMGWKWPADVIRPLAAALERRFDVVDRAKVEFADLRLLTLHFDGEMEPRNLDGKSGFKGRLFYAQAGDMLYSKIDVRNGAIGIVPPSMPTVAVSSEYPVYRVRPAVAISEYVKLLFRTSAFRQKINSMISGASGRKRVQPSDLEEIKVPLPPLPVQQAVVRCWEKAQEEIAKAQGAIRKRQEDLEVLLLRQIGIRLLPPSPRKGAFAFAWSDLERWDTFFYRHDFIDLEKQLTAQKARPLGEVARFVSRPWSRADFPQGLFRYVEISSVTKEEGIARASPVEVDKAPSRATTLIRAGDLLISTTRPYLGSFTIVPREYDNCVCTSGFALADSVDERRVDKRFLLYFLKSPAGLRQMERRMTGGLYPAIVQSELEKIRVPLPPLKVQEVFADEAETVQEQARKDRQAAAKLSAEVAQEVEEMILGTRPVKPGRA